MTDSFAVHLGGGLYLDASGNLVFGPPSGAQIYQSPGGFKLDLKKVQDAFKDLSGILPADEAGDKKWADWGIRGPILKFLSNISGLVGIVSTAIAVSAWALKALLDIMDLMAKDDGMSDELKKTLFSIKDQLEGAEQINRANHMIDMHGDFDGTIDKVHGMLIGLAVGKPTGAARAQIFTDMLAEVDKLAVPLSNLRNQAWATTYNADAYKGRAFASQLLVTLHPDGTLPPVPAQAPNLSVFDYRLGMPMLLYGATAFTAVLQVAMPWFRSAGVFAPHLRKTADAIDRFVIQMQTECLARTEYTAQKVFEQQGWPIFEIPMGMGSGPTGWMTAIYSYAVGAFDLVSYNDAFLGARWSEQFAAGGNTDQRGLFNYHWSTSATSLEDIAAAANDQARQDYVNLQVATGMFHLIRTASWLRTLTTPPDHSQTVSGSAADSRVFRDEALTTAKGSPILGKVITFPATLKRYNARNRVRITTQEPGYKPAFRYRIVLRTLDSLVPVVVTQGPNIKFDGAWPREQYYVGDVWVPKYEPTQGNPRCNRLKTELRQNVILQEVVLYEGPSPVQTVTRGDVANLRATTFDWYVPVEGPWSTYTDVKKLGGVVGVKKMMLGTGGVSYHLFNSDTLATPPMQVMNNPSPLVATVVDELWDTEQLIAGSDISYDNSERRHVNFDYVQVRWQLNWTADKLEVTLTGRPEDRPFQVHLVVEETVYSGELLPETTGDILTDKQLVEQIHTPFVAEMVNQIVFVPVEFFKEERKAMDNCKKKIGETERKYAEQGPVGPGDPVESLQKSIRELTARSSSTSTLAATLNMQAEFVARQAPELWEAVLRQHREPTAS